MKDKFIAKRITELRLQRDISEYKLSYDLGQSKAYIGMITSGRANTSVPMLLAICDYFEITPAEFFAPGFDGEAQNLVENFKRLNDADKEVVKKMIEAFIWMQKERDLSRADDKK